MSMEENKKPTPEELIAELEKIVGEIKDEAEKGNPLKGYLLITGFDGYVKTGAYGGSVDLAYTLANAIHSSKNVKSLLLRALSIIGEYKEQNETSGKEEQRDEEDRKDLN